jgi:NAD(P)H-quinone oxidoreductase subunit 5
MYFSTFEGEFKGTKTALVAQVKLENTPKYLLAEAQELPEGHEHQHHASKPHESPLSMTFPLIALAVPSILIGLVGTPFANYFEAFIHAPGEVVKAVSGFEMLPKAELTEFLIMGGSSVGIGLIGISLAVLMYAQRKISAEAIAKSIQPLYLFSKNKWYIDELYEAVFVQGSRRLARQVLEVDSKIVDGVVNLAGFITLISGEALKYFENGKAQFYALVIFIGVLGLVIVSGTGSLN